MKKLFYYAIRLVEEDDARLSEPQSHDVTYISSSVHYYASGWIHRRIQRMSKYFSSLEKWEYDMLDAFGVPQISVVDAISWEKHWDEE